MADRFLIEEDALEILAHVSLKTFTVTPTSIGPFGAATLRWDVVGPGPPYRFQVMLNHQGVQLRGEQVAQPNATRTYTLVARSSGVSKQLGTVQLTVDKSGCSTFELVNPQWLLQGALDISISKMPGIYKRKPPAVTFTADRIKFALNLGKDVDKFPDPTIKISGVFGLDVEDGGLVNRGATVSANVSFPWWAWGIPGAMAALPIIIGNAEQDAEAGGRSTITDMTNLLSLWWMPEDGKRRHSVRVGTYDDGSGLIEVTECPDVTLRRVVSLANTELADPE